MKLIFLSIVGSQLYGFPKPGDVDMRGCHIMDKEKFAWIYKGSETIEIPNKGGNNPKHTLYDYETHEIRKFIDLLLKSNINFMEMVLSPIRLFKGEYYDELVYIARESICKKCFGQWRGFAKHTAYHAVQEDYKKPKRNLYLLRGYYQGIKLLEEDSFKIRMEDFSDLDCFDQSLVEELYECKINGAVFTSKQKLITHTTELEKRIEVAHTNSTIREKPSDEAYERSRELLNKVRYE